MIRATMCAALCLGAAANTGHAAAGGDVSAADTLLLVASRGEDSLTVFRAVEDRLQPLARIGTGDEPEEIVITADGRTAYIANAGDDTITVLDLDTLGAVDTLSHPRLQRPPGSRSRAIFGLAVSRDGRKLYVGNRAQGALLIMSPEGEILGEIPVADISTIALSPDESRVYAVSDHPQQLVAIDTSKGAVIATINTGRQPKGIAFTPDGQTLILATVAHDAVQFIDTQTLEVKATIGAGRSPQSPVVSPDGKLAFVGTRYLDGGGVLSGISIVNLRNDAYRQVRSVLVGTMIQKLAVSRDGAYLYATCRSITDPTQSLVVLDLLTMEIARFANAGSQASGMAIRSRPAG